MSTKNMVMCAMFTVLISIGAFIKIPTPFVPLTLQVLFVLMAGILLGSKLGALSVVIYVALGLFGVPIFTNGGGLGYVFQPTFGYLLSFIVGAFVTGKICEMKPINSVKTMFFASFVGVVIIYAIGIIYYILINKYVNNIAKEYSFILMYLVLLPLPGDIVSCLIVAVTSKKLIPILKNSQVAA